MSSSAASRSGLFDTCSITEFQLSLRAELGNHRSGELLEMPASDDIWNAALLKSWFPIGHADAFAAALAQKYKCPLSQEIRSSGVSSSWT
ncbi:MAG: hypothetical protein M1541_14650 [Acidobacteria bacterium]|nr:hypothetical protein [Acidobacteriota bacterium]